MVYHRVHGIYREGRVLHYWKKFAIIIVGSVRNMFIVKPYPTRNPIVNQTI